MYIGPYHRAKYEYIVYILSVCNTHSLFRFNMQPRTFIFAEGYKALTRFLHW
jgi:hypothetical protein